MAVTSKIRVGIVGLNAPYAGTPTGTSWAAIAHLPYLKSSDKYELVALQNSTAERAAKAIEAYGLNPDTKAYGTPEGRFHLDSSPLGLLDFSNPLIRGP